MRKTAFVLLFLLASLSFALNVSPSVKSGEIVFRIDGKEYEKNNLTLFLFRDGVQVRGWQKNGVLLPYFHFVPYNESGVYELRAINQKNEYANASVNVTVAGTGSRAKQADEEEKNTELAILVGIAGLAIILYLAASFIKGKSYSK